MAGWRSGEAPDLVVVSLNVAECADPNHAAICNRSYDAQPSHQLLPKCISHETPQRGVYPVLTNERADEEPGVMGVSVNTQSRTAQSVRHYICNYLRCIDAESSNAEEHGNAQ